VEKLPLSEKTAYLKVYINSIGIYAVLYYSHKAINRSYFLKDFTQISNNFWTNEELDFELFWSEYFEALQEKFSWVFWRDGGGREVSQFIDEGTGVDSVEFLIDQHLSNSDKLFAELRKFSIDIKVNIYSEEEKKGFLNVIAKKNNYKEILLLDLNLRSVEVTRYNLDIGKTNLADMNAGVKTLSARRDIPASQD